MGLVGLCWLGLTLSGCKNDCDCGDGGTRRPVRPVSSRNMPTNDTSGIASRPRTAPDTTGWPAAKTGDPSQMGSRPTNMNPTQPDPTASGTPAGDQEFSTVPSGQRFTAPQTMHGAQSMPVSRQPEPSEVVPTSPVSGAGPQTVDIPANTARPEMALPKELSTGTPAPVGGLEMQPASGAPVSGGSAPVVAPAPAVPPAAVPVAPSAPSTPSTSAAPMPGPALPSSEPQVLPVTSGPIPPPAVPTGAGVSMPPPPPARMPSGAATTATPDVGIAPKVESVPPLSSPPPLPAPLPPAAPGTK
jgi:neural Wiskott-Aldrich syndrome protein